MGKVYSEKNAVSFALSVLLWYEQHSSVLYISIKQSKPNSREIRKYKIRKNTFCNENNIYENIIIENLI